LLHLSIDADSRESLCVKKFVKSLCSLSFAHKDDDLVKVNGVKKVSKLSVLLVFLELEEELLKSVESQLGFVVYEDLEGILHEFLGDYSDFLLQCSGEHHYLLLMRSHGEDVLDLLSNIYCH
jgi:hypothetical protein